MSSNPITLASGQPRPPSSTIVFTPSPTPPHPPVTIALVTAASNSHEVDRCDPPRCMLEIGGQPLIELVLSQLQDGGISTVVIQVGQDGDRVKATISKSQASRFPLLQITYCDLGATWRGGACLSLLHAKDAMGDQPFLVFPSDYIYDAGIIENMRKASLQVRRREGERGARGSGARGSGGGA